MSGNHKREREREDKDKFIVRQREDTDQKRDRDREDFDNLHGVTLHSSGFESAMLNGMSRLDAGMLRVHERFDSIERIVLDIQAKDLPERMKKIEGREAVRNRVLGVSMAIAGVIGSVIGAIITYFAFIKTAFKAWLAGS